MKHPPYHLRPNKAVDRLLLLEAIRLLERVEDLSEYTYYGFGGPYLEEFRLLYEFCPQVKMVSIEADNETYKRQEFHLPCGSLKLMKADFRSFLSQYDPDDQKSVFWLDYTGLEFSAFDDFMLLIGRVASNSVVKISLRAEPTDYIERSEEFRAKFDAVMPDSSADPPRRFKDFTVLVQSMVRVAAQRVLPSGMEHTFQPISSFYYSDGTGMLTVTGIVCRHEETKRFRNIFRKWPFANLNWRSPKRIDVPILSTKERLYLAKLLPCDRDAGNRLMKALGYLVDANRSSSVAKMRQYADFHRYFPYFVRAIP